MNVFGMEAFWYGWQQDLRFAIVPPIICAVFRFLFIYIYMGHAGLASGIRERCKNVFRMAFGGGWI